MIGIRLIHVYYRMEKEAVLKPAEILAVDIVMHEFPSVFSIGLEGSYGSVGSYGHKEYLVGDYVPVVSVLCIDGESLHVLIQLYDKVSGISYNRLKVCDDLSHSVKVVLVAVYILPACDSLTVYKVILVPVIISPACIGLSVKGGVTHYAVGSRHDSLIICGRHMVLRSLKIRKSVLP